ncbi:MAG: hypothetical protein GX902_09085, partial [Lentisphaerae bacterium]|nr:hypothetical protein [Lentisphaerota bacterium]
AGVGGLDLGLPSPGEGLILYAGNGGNDQNHGNSASSALLSLQAAADRLSPGDTLYILPGKYDTELRLTRGGSEGKPVRVRAYGKKTVWLAGVKVEAPGVELAGLAVSGAAVGFDLCASDITLRNCGAYQCREAGLRSTGSDRLAVFNCTLADNQTGLALGSSPQAQIRDSILAGNKTLLSADPTSQSTLRSSHNIIAGGELPGYSNWQVEELRFADPAKHDYRLQWDSPAAACDSFCSPAGASSVLPKPLLISNIKIDYLTPNTGIALWETPDDDSFGYLEYWVQGDTQKLRSSSPTQGTRHTAGLKKLRPDTVYEYRVRSNGRRGNYATSEVLSFRTTSTQPEPRTYHLSPNGDDQADGLTPQTAWRSMKKACLAACAGDTFLIQPGSYYDELAPMHGGKPGQPIVFRRNGPGQAIIDGQGLRFQLIKLLDLEHIVIDGLTMINPEEGCRNGVIYLNKCSDISISNCRMGVDKVVYYTSGPFLRAGSCQRLRFENNQGWGGDYPLTLVGCNDVLIKNNTIVDGTMTGSHIVDSREVTIINNLWCRPCIPEKSNQCLFFTAIETDKIVCDYNLFFSPYPTHKVGLIRAGNATPLVYGDNLIDWQKNSPFDKHSIQADPRFRDYEKGDFRLQPDSPALGAGKDGENIGATLPE